jgi:SAM-dependent methyltransferase
MGILRRSKVEDEASPHPFSRGGELGVPPDRWPRKRREELRRYSIVELTDEILVRLKEGERYSEDLDWIVGEELREAIEEAFDYHNNRYGPRRYYDLLRPILAVLPRTRLRGATLVDLGCGSIHPFAFSFLFLLLGAERAYAVDLEPILDFRRAVKALAACASWMLLDSKRILDPDSIPPREVLDNLRGFDLAKLRAGDPAGLAGDRLVFLQEDVFRLSLEEGEADVVFSNSFFEHMPRLDDLLESLRRVTKVGGYGHHLVDFSDHRVYPGLVESPFEFLKLETDEEMVNGANRLRCGQLCSRFEKHGFSVRAVETARHAPLSPEEHASFAEPFRSMSREDLERICARILVQRTR